MNRLQKLQLWSLLFRLYFRLCINCNKIAQNDLTLCLPSLLYQPLKNQIQTICYTISDSSYSGTSFHRLHIHKKWLYYPIFMLIYRNWYIEFKTAILFILTLNLKLYNISIVCCTTFLFTHKIRLYTPLLIRHSYLFQ